MLPSLSLDVTTVSHMHLYMKSRVDVSNSRVIVEPRQEPRLTGVDPGFGQGGGAQVLRPKVADEAKRSRASEASNLRPGSRARLRALEAFGFLMLKYAFSHILETLFL